MSGQWEVVGKKKGRDNKLLNKQNIKDAKKNNGVQGPKIEDVFAPLQVKNLYASNKNNKENAKPPEKPKQEIKKPPKKQEKSQEQAKVKPKTIENALNSIDAEELKNLFENNKKLFPDSPIIWLKELSQFLNQKIHVDLQDHTFSNKSENYPFSAVPHSIRSVIEKAVKDVGRTSAQTFYGISLTSMATDMGKGMPVIGHKLFLQYLALYEPKFSTASLNKHKDLKNSYQNQQSIGLSILWALGQCGNKDFESGFKVFQEIMFPMIEMKNYSRYVTKYLIDLINRHHLENLSKEQYLLILDIVFANYKNFPADLRPSLNKIVPVSKQMLLNQYKKESSSTIIEPLLKKILSSNNNAYRKEICDILVNCFIKDPSLFNSWNKIYNKNIQSSAFLLKYIDENWKRLSALVDRGKFQNLLSFFTETNEDLKASKKKLDGLEESNVAIKNLKIKMASKKSSKISYNFMSFLLLLGFAAILAYDIKLHGCWYQSSTYKGLKNAGAIEYYNKAVEKGRMGLHWVHERLDERFPDYYQQHVEPYLVLLNDIGFIVWNAGGNLKQNIINEKIPTLVDHIEFYAPGLIDKSQKTLQSAWSISVLYVNNTVKYLQQEVFVGHLAPENVQRVVVEALDTTKRKATEYCYWVYEKVQSSIK
ncbi:transmembrane protein 214-A [Agrilus planipennis]|uniref:Transmembrane protein 214-A n=1 Tax=Agrilus planipennis TaxID=224129 RepID=A0A1W4XHL7_AGRPL|nr:transmembrane protein 214-A [Agrilus planipennis]